MERVAFLVEATGEHISALLNPEAVVMTRTAGLRERRSSGGRLTGTGLADDPVLLTGGGRTELRLDLLFDVDLVPQAAARPSDVRELTRPLWDLSENPGGAASTRQSGAPVRFVWGRAWNVPGVVASVAERFDRFDAGGAPLRSWLRLRFLRTRPLDDQAEDDPVPDDLDAQGVTLDLTGAPVGTVVPVTDGSDPDAPELPPGALGDLSMAAFGTPFRWKDLLTYNGVDDPRSAVFPLDVPPLQGPLP